MAFENGARGISPRVSSEEDGGRTRGDGSGPDGGTNRYRRGTRTGTILVTVMACVFYSIFGLASAGGCAGGYSSDGGYVDVNGNPATAVPQCISITFEPKLSVILLLLALTGVGLLWIGRRKYAGRSARRAFWVTVVAVVVVTLYYVVPTYAYLSTEPVDHWMKTGTIESVPGWTGVTITTSEME